MSIACLLTGSNLGNRLNNLETISELIEERIGHIINSSSIYETEPWGFEHDNYFYNQALIAKTRLSPAKLIYEINAIENLLGRVRNLNKYEARTADVDILFYDNIVMNDSLIIIPHPRMHERRFVLAPLHEIIPDYIHPKLNKTVKQLLIECRDEKKINKV